MEDRCELLCLDLQVAERLRTKRLAPATAQTLGTRAQALADPTRLSLLAALLEAGELCVCDLAWIAERAQNLVSHHMRVLRTAGLVRSRRDGKMVMYSVTERAEALVDALLADTADVPA